MTTPIKPYAGESYQKNSKRGGEGTEPCVHCGKPIKKPWTFAARVVEGGGRYATATEIVHLEAELAAGRDAEEPWGDMYCFPVGSECASKLLKSGVHVFRWTEKAE